LECFEHYAQSAFLLASLLVIPLIQLETTFDQNRTAFFQILSDRFSLPAKRIDIHKSHIFFLFPSFIRPATIDGKADLRNGSAFGRVAQFRIARQIAGEDDFIEVGHIALRLDIYFAAASAMAGASVKSTRNTSLFSPNLCRSCDTISGPASKMTFT
jgi:hypothetical protein